MGVIYGYLLRKLVFKDIVHECTYLKFVYLNFKQNVMDCSVSVGIFEHYFEWAKKNVVISVKYSS